MTTNITPEQLQKSIAAMNQYTKLFGFECAPFKVQWYNNLVDAKYALKFDGETIGISFISNPDMFATMQEFGKNLPPNYDKEYMANPIQTVTKYYVRHFDICLVQKYFNDPKSTTIFDWETVQQTPKLLVQTSGHVAGQAYYYRPPPQAAVATSAVDNKDPTPPVKLYGASLHPIYGGFFAFRGAIFMPSVTCTDLVEKEPIEVFKGDQDQILNFLTLFSKFEATYRDVIPVGKRYSMEQVQFFNTAPECRILHWVPKKEQ